MGPRHKAGSHILDLAPPLASTAAAAAQPTAAAPPLSAAALKAATLPPPKVETLGLADSTPDIDAALADAGLVAAAGEAAATLEQAAASAAAVPDYDTAKEWGGLAGSKAMSGSRLAPRVGAAAEAGSGSSGSSGEDGAPAAEARSLPAAATDYSLAGAKKAAKKGKKKRSRK
jgi:hypothetical protein